MLLPLEMLQRGEWARVMEVGGEPAWVGRLAELGVRSGAKLEMLQPGSPCLIRLNGCRLSLRAESVEHILVTPVSHDAVEHSEAAG